MFVPGATARFFNATMNCCRFAFNDGVRANVVSPGPTKTPGFFDLAGPDAARQQGMLDALASRIPMGRVGDPDEIAKAAVFLASDDSSFVNGIELFVDGGKAQI